MSKPKPSSAICPITWATKDWSEVQIYQVKDHHNFVLWGQAVSGSRNCIVVEQLGIVFDMGFLSSKSVGQSVVLISHGHADHIGALHMHAFDRKMTKMPEPTYVMPIECVEHFNISHDAYKTLNKHGEMENDPSYQVQRYYHIIPSAKPDSINEPVDIMILPKEKPRYRVTAHRTIHGVPSNAYVIWEKKWKLREDLDPNDREAIIKLVKRGISVNKTVETPILGYTGDTTIEGVLRHQDLLNCETLIMECTYLDTGTEHDTPDKAKERGHIHERDIVDNLGLFKNKEIILCHFSRRYSRDEIFNLQERLQSLTDDIKIQVFIN